MEFRQALRALMRSGASSGFAVMTLAFGIAASSAVFTVTDDVLFRSLPYPDAASLVVVTESNRKMNADRYPMSPADFLDLKEENAEFSHMSAYRRADYNLTGNSRSIRVSGAQVSPTFFRTLGSDALHGRTFADVGEVKVEVLQAVISYELWKREFGESLTQVGGAIRLDGRSYEVIGVMPAEFRSPIQADLWVPLFLERDDWRIRDAHFLRVIARLSPNVTVDQARMRAQAISQRLESIYIPA